MIKHVKIINLIMAIMVFSCQKVPLLDAIFLPTSYSVGGFVENLAGQGLEIVLLAQIPKNIDIKQAGYKSSFSKTFNENGLFKFEQPLPSGAIYVAKIISQPVGPNQLCAIANPEGSISDADINNIAINCNILDYSIGGVVNGLTGKNLILQLNGKSDLIINSNGTFGFDIQIEDGESFNIQVSTQPTEPVQICSASKNSGILNGRKFDGIKVNCSDKGFIVAGFVVGLEGSPLVLENNGTNNLNILKSGFFRFSAQVADGAGVNVQVSEQPLSPKQICSVFNVPGTIRNENKIDVIVTCSSVPFLVGGNVSGLVGDGLQIVINGGSPLNLFKDGKFIFADAQADGSSYVVSILQQPIGPQQSCSVNNNSGAVKGEEISNIEIICATQSFSLGGFLAGYNAEGLVLENNQTDDLAIAENNFFQFNNPLIDNSQYSVRVKTHPKNPGQICDINGNEGVIDGADVNSIFVNCVDAFSIGGSISGLEGNGLILENSTNGDLLLIDIPVNLDTQSTQFKLNRSIKAAEFYSLNIKNNPDALSQTCSFDDADKTLGQILFADVNDINITCSTNSFIVSGKVQGLTQNSIGVRLTSNASIYNIDLPATGNDIPFLFDALALLDGSSYVISIYKPAGGHFCSPEGGAEKNGSGILAGSDVTDILINCIPDDRPPTILSLTSTTLAGTYVTGDVIPLTLKLNKAVTVDESGGTAVLMLNSGAQAVYSSGSGSDELIFIYTISPGDNITALSITGTDSLILNGSIISDLQGEVLNILMPLTGSGNLLSELMINIDAFAAALSTPVLQLSEDSGLKNDNITNIAALNFSGTSEPNSQIDIYNYSTLLTSGTADISGNWLIDISLPTDADYSLSVVQSDPFGNISINSDSLLITLDTSVSKPSAIGLNTTSDTGILDNDNLTSLTLLEISGSAEAAASIEVFLNGFSSLGVFSVDSGGNWSGMISLGNGFTHLINAVQTDIAGNVSIASDNLAISVDSDAPVLASVLISSNNANGSYAKPGDIITINFTSNESITTPNVTILGQAASVSGGPTTWNTSLTLTTEENEGKVTFLISAINDLAGNSTTDINSTSDSSSVTYDKTAAIFNAVTIATNNSDTTLATIGDEITLSFTTSEDILSPIVTILGQSASISGGPINWNALYTTQGSDTEGIVLFTISNIINLVGITTNNVTTQTSGANVTFSKTVTSILSIETMDIDSNGKIDHYKLTFSEAMDDSTFTGYGGINAEGTDASVVWSVSGHLNLRIDTTDGRFSGIYNAADDIDDDAVIYLAFDESSSYDTDAKPDVTTTGITLKNIVGITNSDIATDFTETDKAPPIFTAWSDPIIDAWQLRLLFSEPVDKTSGGGCSGTLTNTDFTYTDTSTAGVTNIRSDFADNNGCDVTNGGYYIIPRVDTQFIYGDFSSDTIALSSTFFDSADNPVQNVSKVVTYDPNLEVYYPMNVAVGDSISIVKDVSGNGRDGTPSGGPKLTNDMGERNSQAYLFDGVDDTIAISSIPALGTSDFTLFAWIKTNSTDRNDFIGFGSDSVANRGIRLFIYEGIIHFDLHLTAGPFISAEKYNNGSWHPVAVTNTSGTIQLYANGVSKNSGVMAPDITAENPLIGNASGLGPQNFAGTLDEIRIYSRALSATEIKKLSVKVPGGLVAHYPMDDNSGAAGQITDLSGNGINGTNNNATWTTDRHGNTNNAMSFSDDFIEADDTLLPMGSTARTVCAWSYSNEVPSAGKGTVLFAYGDNSGNNSFLVAPYNALTTEKRLGIFSNSSNQKYVELTQGDWPINKWVHYCVSTTGSSGVNFYQNGLELTNIGTNNSYSMATVSAGVSRIGVNLNNGSYFNGFLDDIRIYNRVLSSGEVKAMATELDRGLVAYYPLDDNTTSTAADAIKDYSGNNYHLTLSTGPVPTVDRNQNSNGAYLFNGSGELRRNAAAMTQLSVNTEDRTMCVWVTADNASGGINAIYYGTNDGTFNAHYKLRISSGLTASIEFHGGGYVYGQITVSIGNGTWFHVCGRYSGSSQTIEIFVNGIKENKTTGYNSGITGNDVLVIGNDVNNFQKYKGAIDDIRIYNRVLSVSEIRELSGFFPGHVEDLTLWLDVERAVFSDNGSTLAVNNDKVKQWWDLTFNNGSLNAFHATDNNETSGPTFIADGGVKVNNKPVLRFNGVDTALNLSGNYIFSSSGITMFVVMRSNNAFNTDTDKDFILDFGKYVDAGYGLIFNYDRIQIWSSNGAPVALPTGITSSDFVIVGARFNLPSTTVDFLLNADIVAIGGTVVSALTAVEINEAATRGNSEGPFTIGSAAKNINRSTRFLGGDIAEVIVYTRAITEDERLNIECYLAKKYALTGSLPANYCD